MARACLVLVFVLLAAQSTSAWSLRRLGAARQLRRLDDAAAADAEADDDASGTVCDSAKSYKVS